MDNFEYVYENFTKKEEGGYFPDPDQPGGPTNMGISTDTLRNLKKKKLIDQSITSVKELDEGKVKGILRKQYWRAVRGDELPLDLAAVLFDTAVLSGPPRAVRMLQQVLKVKQDGHLGPDTMEAIRNYKGDLVGDILSARSQAQEQVSKAEQGTQEYRKGWPGRTSRLGYFVDYGPPVPPVPAERQGPPASMPGQNKPNTNPGYHPSPSSFLLRSRNLLEEPPFEGLYGAGSADDPAHGREITATTPAPALRHVLLGFGPWPPPGGKL